MTPPDATKREPWRRDARGRWQRDEVAALEEDADTPADVRFSAIVSLVVMLHIGVGASMRGQDAANARERETFESRISLEAPPPPPPLPPVEPPPPAPEPKAAPPVAVAPRPPAAKATVLEAATGPSDIAIDAVVADTATMPAAPVPSAPPVSAPAPAPPTPRADPGPTIVPAKSLGRLPHPPALDRELERNYPAEARRAGIAGSATLRLQVLSDGRLGRVQHLAESHPGFGAACERTVRAARWDPPLDREGRAVATEIKYVCRFEVRS